VGEGFAIKKMVQKDYDREKQPVIYINEKDGDVPAIKGASEKCPVYVSL